MTRDEVKRIVMVIATTYPNWKPENMTNLVDVWTMIFRDYDASIIQKALMAYIQNDKKGFAPVPGQIIGSIDPGKEVLNEEQAWSLVYKAISNSYYNSVEEFAKLPPECQKAIGNAYNLKALSMMDTETTQSVEKSHFLKTYRAELDKKARYDRTADGLIETKNNAVTMIETKSKLKKSTSSKLSEMEIDGFVEKLKAKIGGCDE